MSDQPHHLTDAPHQKDAASVENDEFPLLTDAVDDEEIPVLLEVEVAADAPTENTLAFAPVADAEAPATLAPAPLPDEKLPEAVLHELAQRLERRLTDELPRLIEATLREYLAEQAVAERRHD